MADGGVKPGDKVLLIWAQPSAPAALRQYAEELGGAAGAEGRVSVENLDRLLLCKLPFSSSPSLFLDGFLVRFLIVASLPLLSLPLGVQLRLRALLPAGRQLHRPQPRHPGGVSPGAETWWKADY